MSKEQEEFVLCHDMKSKDALPKRIIEPYPRQSKAAFDKERMIFLLAFTLLCFCCLFADGLPVLDSHIRSKWFGMLFFSAVLGLSILFFHNIESFYFRSSDLVFSFLVLYIAVRSVERGSPMYGLQMLSIVLLYLSFRAVGQYCIKELFAVISAFTVLLALWGICQSVHILPGGNDGFSAIGSFDNPAGYASALAIGFPTIVYLWKNKNKGWRVAGYISAILVVLAIVLSKSRAGIVAVSLVLFSSFVFGVKNKSRWWKAILACTFFLVIVVILYFLKRDSADGRLLIWMVSLRLISKFLLFGGGTGAFGAMYMPEQASYFRLHPGSRFAMLADNVGHPLNEYLSIVVQWGLIGLVLFSLLIYLIIKAWQENRCKETDTSFLILLSLGSFSCFSYPLSYPFGWVMLVFCISCSAIYAPGVTKKRNSFPFKYAFYVILSLFLFGSTYFFLLNYKQWFKVSSLSFSNTERLDNDYSCLYPKLKRDPTFLYNYATFLYGEQATKRAEEISQECLSYLTDYNTLFLLGSIYMAKGEDGKAKETYKELAEMCPNRFLPLYEMFLLAARNNQEEEARSLCETILGKEIKIYSDKVLFIKTRCYNYLREKSLLIY